MTAFLRVSPATYRVHLEQPEFLSTLLSRAAEVITAEQAEWTILEGQHPFLVTEIDFELYHPAQRPVGSQVDWQLSGCATAALIALHLQFTRKQHLPLGESA